MAQQISVSIYQINSLDPIPLASVTAIGFPTAGIMIRGTDVVLSTGVHAYSQINVLATGATYIALQTAATLITAANA